MNELGHDRGSNYEGLASPLRISAKPNPFSMFLHYLHHERFWSELMKAWIFSAINPATKPANLLRIQHPLALDSTPGTWLIGRAPGMDCSNTRIRARQSSSAHPRLGSQQGEEKANKYTPVTQLVMPQKATPQAKSKFLRRRPRCSI